VAILPGILVRNWPLKLAALALAVILWVLVASEETTSQLVEVRVEVDLPGDLALAKPAPILRALVTGPGRELIKLYTNPLTIHASVPASTQPPHWRLVVAPSDVLVSRNARVSVQDVEPRSLEFDLDRLAHRDVPVAVRGMIEAESGFAVSRPLQIVPAMVRVSGPRALVMAVDSIPTEAVEIRGVTGPFERKVPLDTTRRALLRIVPHEVTVSGRTRRS
jgi:hypothetical protein